MMNTLVEGFFRKHPRHAASILESHPHELFVNMLHETHADVDKVLPYLSTHYLTQLLSEYTEDVGHQLCACMSPNLAAKVLRRMKPEKRNTLLMHFTSPHKKMIQSLIEFTPDQLGYFCQYDDLAFTAEHTVQEALKRLDQWQDSNPLMVVITPEARLMGILNPFTLLKHREQLDKPLSQLCEPAPVTLPGAAKVQHALHHPAWEADLKLPVVGHQFVFLGVISKSILSKQYLRQHPKHLSRNPVEDYFEFSELLWGGLQKFWSSIK